MERRKSTLIINKQSSSASPDKEQEPGKEKLSKSVIEKKSHLDRYVDNYWKRNLEGKDLSISEIDEIIHKFIHNLLLMAEDDPQQQHAVHLKNQMIQHQEMILSIKDAIKPGIFQTFYKPYSKDQIKEYFTMLQVKKSKQNKKQVKAKLVKKMTTDFELQVNTEHFIKNDKDNFVKNE